MIFDILVTAMTSIAAGFILLWRLVPRFRLWVEAPKYRFLAQERLFEGSQPEKSDASSPSGGNSPGNLNDHL